MSVKQVLATHDSHDLSEWMAFDRLKDEDFRARLESENMGEDDRNAAIKALLGGA